MGQKSQTQKSQTKKNQTHKSGHHATTVFCIIILLLLAGLGAIYYFVWRPSTTEPTDSNTTEPTYSTFTGEVIANADLNNSPTYCVQIPNGSTDGARPQVSLDKAGVVFEAIAEAGITRFAAIFQNTDATIGPIRSLRPYYLDWDTPFDCTVVHAGGSDEALAAIAWGGQRNLDENYTYMWRETPTNRLWNNLFTDSSLLKKFNDAHNYTTSNPKAFPRLTPKAVNERLSELSDCAAAVAEGTKGSAECPDTSATEISVRFGNLANYNVIYTYDPEENVYLRRYQTGAEHLVYSCAGTTSDITSCPLVQISPSVIAVIHVEESLMADQYHEQITTIGSGRAEIFQNGEVIKGTWSKASQSAQIIFRDQNNQEIAFNPGQIWIEAIPNSGGNVLW